MQISSSRRSQVQQSLFTPLPRKGSRDPVRPKKNQAKSAKQSRVAQIPKRSVGPFPFPGYGCQTWFPRQISSQTVLSLFIQLKCLQLLCLLLLTHPSNCSMGLYHFLWLSTFRQIKLSLFSYKCKNISQHFAEHHVGHTHTHSYTQLHVRRE